ncbi:MAG: hypothetical protein COA99_12795 [Moraxellaceae bacterium]|nr:MAG: hypothetical protein COA99_12795 [Moraxellaceae bacterium]
MIRLLIVFIVLVVAWQLFRMSSRQATLEEARTIGLQRARSHIQSPILLEDYAVARGIPEEELGSWIEKGEMPSYRWRQYTYIEDRELIEG